MARIFSLMISPLPFGGNLDALSAINAKNQSAVWRYIDFPTMERWWKDLLLQ